MNRKNMDPLLPKRRLWAIQCMDGSEYHGALLPTARPQLFRLRSEAVGEAKTFWQSDPPIAVRIVPVKVCDA